MALCPCKSCNKPQNLTRINATITRQQRNFIASKPNIATIMVPENLLQGSFMSTCPPEKTLLGLPDELLLKICDYIVPKEDTEITEEDFADAVFFSLSCKRLLSICGKLMQTKTGTMDVHAYGSSDKLHLLCRMADGWLADGTRICWACWRFRPFGADSKPKWLQMVAGQPDRLRHAKRAELWLQNWEVKSWFGESSGKSFTLQSDDERLRCPSCVFKGYRITLSPFFVNRRNTQKGGGEIARKEAEKEEKDRKEQEERSKIQRMEEEADRVLAEELAAAGARIRGRPAQRDSEGKGNKVVEDARGAKQQNGGGDVSDSDMNEKRGESLQEAQRGVKRKGDKIVEGANQSKWQKSGGDAADSNMREEQEENLQPSGSHNILHCRCGDCDEEFFRRINRDDSDFESDYDLDFN